MSPETGFDQRGTYTEALLLSVDRLSCDESQKTLLRRIIKSNGVCDVVRSDGRREHGTVIGIADGRIAVAVKDGPEQKRTVKNPRLETFMSWQETSGNP